jgi:hypothetical protein
VASVPSLYQTFLPPHRATFAEIQRVRISLPTRGLRILEEPTNAVLGSILGAAAADQPFPDLVSGRDTGI